MSADPGVEAKRATSVAMTFKEPDVARRGGLTRYLALASHGAKRARRGSEDIARQGGLKAGN
jgi:hypothetical protein